MMKNSVTLLSSSIVAVLSALLSAACSSDAKTALPDAPALTADAPIPAIDSNVATDAHVAIDAAPPTPITLFVSQSPTGGTMGGRDGADFACMTSAGSLTCPSGVHALISIDDTDQLKDIPTNLSLPTDAAIVTITGVVVAANWADLLDGTIDHNLEDAGLFAPDSQSNFWTGSGSDGSVSNTCQNWTSSDPSDTAEVGASGATDVTWLDDGGLVCNATSDILCLCY